MRYAVSGTATSGADFTRSAATLSMGRNTTAEITVTPIDDSEPEGFETVTVTITPDATYTTHLDAERDDQDRDDDQPVVAFRRQTQISRSHRHRAFLFFPHWRDDKRVAVNYTLSGTATSARLRGARRRDHVCVRRATAQLDLTPINDTTPGELRRSY